MSDNQSHVDLKKGSEKGFGIIFAIVFALIGLWPLLESEPIYKWALGITVILLIISFTIPKIFAIPNKLWFKFGIFLGSIIGPLFTLGIYFLTVLPTGMIMKLLYKDLLNEKLDKNIDSYWIKRKIAVGSMKNQF